MSKTTQLDTMKAQINTLSHNELTNTKGGLLIYCEEKRSTFLGITYKTTQWKVANNGSLFVTIRM